ncbi:hypothetical protein ACHAXA_007207 [Cyclostephanos tholiformis]|uniref:glycine--tRNA ligase n=1 Tax=Cyclostephanos tholiformis TaxID=382380 RepID=A0ABD3SG87_9STRA
MLHRSSALAMFLLSSLNLLGNGGRREFRAGVVFGFGNGFGNGNGGIVRTVITTTIATRTKTTKGRATALVGTSIFGSTAEAEASSSPSSPSSPSATDNAPASSSTTTSSSTSTSSSSSSSSYDYSKLKMEDVVSLCKRRGIVFPSSEIYNGYAGFFDYGPLGTELKRNVKDAFWTEFVRAREDVVGIDSSIIHNPSTWKSSGHLDGFSDPMVDCRETKLRYRADQLYTSPAILLDNDRGGNDKDDGDGGGGGGILLGYVTVMEGNDVDMIKSAETQAKKLLKESSGRDDVKDARSGRDARFKPFEFVDLTQVTEDIMRRVPSPGSGKPTLTMPRDFNLMFSTNVGAMQDATSLAYLRPETAQGIFINYKNVLGSSRLKLPFGIAQIGKAFRNEITPRNFIFRSREFEQMEIEYFIPPGDEEVWGPYHRDWIRDSRSFLEGVGLRSELLGYDVHSGDGLAHYARACTDITFKFPFGTQELMGIAARGDFDLRSHTEGSGKVLDYFDEDTKEKFTPHVIEPSLGVDRLVLALICSAYAEDEINGEKRNYLSFHPRIAPVKVAVLPLVKNKEPLVDAARALFGKLQRRWNVMYDQTGAIGRRYRRADEIGVPYCITVDFDTIEKDGAVTVRDRDTTEQVRIPLDEVVPYLSKMIDGY